MVCGHCGTSLFSRSWGVLLVFMGMRMYCGNYCRVLLCMHDPWYTCYVAWGMALGDFQILWPRGD